MSGGVHYARILRDASGEPDPLRGPFDTDTGTVGHTSQKGKNESRKRPREVCLLQCGGEGVCPLLNPRWKGGIEKNYYNMALRIMMAVQAQSSHHWPDGAFYQCTLAEWTQNRVLISLSEVYINFVPRKSRGGWCWWSPVDKWRN